MRLLLALVILAPTRSVAVADEGYGAQATATRERFEEARSRTVVTQEEAERTAPANVSDALESAHGVIVQRTASGSGTPLIRGLTGYQVLMMADDLRLNDSLTRAGGSAFLNLIDPESVERIEVIRGPASVLYGSDALGGVVHVHTKTTGVGRDAHRDGAEAAAGVRGASAEHAARAHASARLTRGPFGAMLSGNRGSNGATIRGDDLGPQPYTGHEEWSLAGRIEVAPARRQVLSLAHQSGHLFDMPRPDVSEPDDVQTTSSLDRDATVLRYAARVLDGRLRLTGFAGVIARREVRDRFRSTGEQRERERVLAQQSGVRASVATPRAGNVEVGFETSIERIDSTRRDHDETGTKRERGRGRYVDGSSYDMFGLYGLYTQPLTDKLLLLAGARGTLVHAKAPSDPLFTDLMEANGPLDRRFFGAAGSLGLRRELPRKLRLTASLLGGFRAPNLEDFQAFGGGARGFTVPNQGLHEERSWTFESGLELDTEYFDAQLYGFGTYLTGLVVRVPTTYLGQTMVDDEPVITRRNASDSVLIGGELSMLGRTDFGLYAGVSTFFTWGTTERPDDRGATVHEPANKVPPPIGVARLGVQRAGTPLFGEGVLVAQFEQTRLSAGDRDDVRLCADSTRCGQVDGYAVISLRAGIHLDENVLLMLAAENILDALYKTYASAAYSPGRNFVAMLRGRLGS